MDPVLIKEMILWLGAGGTGLFTAFKLFQKFNSSARASIAADNQSTIILDRLERQLKEQADQFRISEDRYIANVQRLEARGEIDRQRADKAERERNEALTQVDRLAWTVETLREQVKKLEETVGRYVAQQSQH